MGTCVPQLLWGGRPRPVSCRPAGTALGVGARWGRTGTAAALLAALAGVLLCAPHMGLGQQQVCWHGCERDHRGGVGGFGGNRGARAARAEGSVSRATLRENGLEPASWGLGVGPARTPVAAANQVRECSGGRRGSGRARPAGRRLCRTSTTCVASTARVTPPAPGRTTKSTPRPPVRPPARTVAGSGHLTILLPELPPARGAVDAGRHPQRAQTLGPPDGQRLHTSVVQRHVAG